MDLYQALYTTRAMRRVKPDPVPDDVIAKLMDAAVRAPSGGNTQKWRFLFVTDDAKKSELQKLYSAGLAELNATQYKSVMDLIRDGDPLDPLVVQAKKTNASAMWLSENLHKVPVLLFAWGKPNGESSLFPALWSLQLAANAEGLGTSLTTLLFKKHTQQVLDILGAPPVGEWVPMAMITIGYPTGKWGVAKRQPPHEVAFANTWGNPVTWSVQQPMWPEATL
ncbi:MAG: nitroreductase family protein [Actinobacteria bacterium]|nr:nitroreductase family protein [Actinomycetota bacterium]